MIDAILSAITLVNATRGVYRLVTGTTATDKLDRIAERLDKLTDDLHHLSVRQVRDLTRGKQRVVTDLTDVCARLSDVPHILDTPVAVSTPILSPPKLVQTFERGPELLLHDIRALDDVGSVADYTRDPTMIPVVFAEGSQHHIGLMKRGYAEDYLAIAYRPIVAAGPTAVAPGRGYDFQFDFDFSWEFDFKTKWRAEHR